MSNHTDLFDQMQESILFPSLDVDLPTDEMEENWREAADYDDEGEDLSDEDDYDDPMDGDHESALASAGWGTDEDYGLIGGDSDLWGEF